MLIGEIVRQTGLSRDTIRYYERLGLVQAEGRPGQHNNYKSYPATTVARLTMIQRGKTLGLSLAEIAEGFALLDNGQFSDAEVQARAVEKLTQLDEKIAALQAMRNALLYSIEQLQHGHCVIQRYRAGRAEHLAAEAEAAAPGT